MKSLNHLAELDETKLKALWSGLRLLVRHPEAECDPEGNDLPSARVTKLRTGKLINQAQFETWKGDPCPYSWIKVYRHASGRVFAKINYLANNGEGFREYLEILGYDTALQRKYRLSVCCLNHSDGWFEYATSKKLRAALESEEKGCRRLARLIAKDDPSFFVSLDYGSKAEIDAEIERQIYDLPDDNGNEPDLPVFSPTVEQWVVDEDGYGEWQEIEIYDIP